MALPPPPPPALAGDPRRLPPPVDLADEPEETPPYAAPLTVVDERRWRWGNVAVAAGLSGLVALLAGAAWLQGTPLPCPTGDLCAEGAPLLRVVWLLVSLLLLGVAGAAASSVARRGRWPRRSAAAGAVALGALWTVLLHLVFFVVSPSSGWAVPVLAAVAAVAGRVWWQDGRFHRIRDAVAVLLVLPASAGLMAEALAPLLDGRLQL